MDSTVRAVRVGQLATLIVSGEIDLSNADELTAAGLKALADNDARTLVVDLAAVTYFDSQGLAALVSIRQQAELTGAALVIANPPPRIRRLFRITGLDHAFTISDEHR